jgi:CubicO group peptidase (beta-lactamase class C family)
VRRSGRRVGPAWLVPLALALVVGCTGPRAGEADVSRPSTPVAGRVAAVADEFHRAVVDVRAVSVWVGSRPLVERYYDSSAVETSDVASVADSVLSILVGIAIDEGAIRGTEETLAELLPRHAASMAPRLRTATLCEVLTMTAGLPADGVAGLLSSPSRRPGQVFEYSRGAAHLLAAILVEATGRPVLEFARDKLFDPLGIDSPPAATRTGKPGIVGWKLTASDMAKIGRLMLAGGHWDGRQVVSRRWVDQSTRAHVRTAGTSATTDQYGYLWWVTSADNHVAFAAIGTGGQLIEVVPDLDLVTVVSTRITDVTHGQERLDLGLVDQVIAPVLAQ